LNRWGAADASVSPEYAEALALIKRGQERLAKQDRGEASDFAPVADVEIDQEKRYNYFRQREEAARAAVSKGEKLNDLQIDALVGSTWRDE
jgi:hypothetical protein